MINRRTLLLAPLLLTACAKRSGARPLFAAESQPENYPTTQGLYAIDQILKERTNGEMRVRVYPRGPLGAEKDTLEIARSEVHTPELQPRLFRSSAVFCPIKTTHNI